MGGLIVGTVLTLAFVPALYAAWFRVRTDAPNHSPEAAPDATNGALTGPTPQAT